MRCLPLLVLALALPSLGWADLRLPPKPTMMEKLARGIANVGLATSELLDSNYEILQEKGPTYAYTVGIVQGVSRVIMDAGVGALEIGTFFIPTKSMKMPAHDTGQVEPLPPADLIDNWY
ncbi:MAG: exosortase system-associated protein, TIGR04073 family [Verrucomicrobia bacterium]|nr:exosortase system-associated protein, TIGR04073 family [Verrucomicrobiota bacterium]